MVGTRFATVVEPRILARFGLYNVLSLTVRGEVPVVPVTDVTLIGDAAPAVVTIPTAALVDARFTRAPVVAVRDDVALRVDLVVVVRATVPEPVEPVRVADVCPAPPVARAAAAFVAATFVVVRVAAVDVVRDVVPRDVTLRAFVDERGEVFDVPRAATARDEFAADARPVAAPALPVGTVRPIVVRFVFARDADPLRDAGTEGVVTFSSVSGVKSASV